VINLGRNMMPHSAKDVATYRIIPIHATDHCVSDFSIHLCYWAATSGLSGLHT